MTKQRTVESPLFLSADDNSVRTIAISSARPVKRLFEGVLTSHKGPGGNAADISAYPL